jgi:hypothetical protein
MRYIFDIYSDFGGYFFFSSSSTDLRNMPSGLFPLELFWNFGSYKQSVGLLGRVMSSVQRRDLYRPTPTGKEFGQTSIPRMGFKPAIPVYERAKTIHDLELASTVTGPVDI